MSFLPGFLFPMAWAGLLSVPVIIAMYLLKQKYTDMKVPSLFLWKEAVSLSQAQRPWQKLKRSLLMLLQILLAFLLTLSLAGPYVSAHSPAAHMILVLDASMSMQAEDDPPSRFEKAKADMTGMVEAAKPGTKITLIIGQATPYIAVNGSDDKKAVIGGIRAASPTYAGMDEKAAASLAAMAAADGEYSLVVFSDRSCDFGELAKTDALYGQSDANTSVELAGSVHDADRVVTLAKVKNHGPGTVENSLALYRDGLFHDLKPVTLGPFEEKDVFFTDIPADARLLEARLETGDILTADDAAYDVVQPPVARRVMLVTERNVFLENALNLLPTVELVKTAPENAEDVSGCALYVFDGVLPEKLPTDGHLLVLNPPEGNALLDVTGETAVTGMTAQDSALLELLGDIRFDVAKSKVMAVPEWADAALSCDDTPLVLAGGWRGQKIVVMGFDLHNTDLPLRKEFPIFIYNLAQYFIPGSVAAGGTLLTEANVTLNAYPDAKRVSVVGPDEVLTELAPPFPVQPFAGARLPGFYTVMQELAGETRFDAFAVNVPPEESDLSRPAPEPGAEPAAPAGSELPVNKMLAPGFLAAALALLCAEWWVFCRGR